MADAPAGGNGWGALEIVLAVVLAIGLITTLTNTKIGSNAPAAPKTTVSTTPSCGIIFSQPTVKEKIFNQVTVEGIIVPCASSLLPPDTLNAYVADSTGNVISPYTTMTVNKSFFGNASFDAVIPLQGVAHSTSAHLIITSSVTEDGHTLNASVPLILLPGPTTTTTTTTGSYFVPTTNGSSF